MDVILTMQASIAALENALAIEFDRHAARADPHSARGPGTILAARLLAEIGDDPTRSATADGRGALVGVLRDHQIREYRRRHYDRRRTAGDGHSAALRNLGDKLLGRMWWCLAHNQPWDEHAAWPDLHTQPETNAA